MIMVNTYNNISVPHVQMIPNNCILIKHTRIFFQVLFKFSWRLVVREQETSFSNSTCTCMTGNNVHIAYSTFFSNEQIMGV